MMEKYNYRDEITNDIKQWIIENNWIYETYGDTTPNYFNLIDNLNDTLWAESSISGNGIEGFYDTEEKCEEYVCHNLTLYFKAAREFDDWPVMYDIDWIYKNPAQHMDCTIRCYLLGECIDRALQELGVKYE